ncbi:hypothetical protein BG004_006332 [Podila humilis]|nr:hypothetical protein BG004_006332 [Podila humilis]
MPPITVFVTGTTGYIGGTFMDLWLNKSNTIKDFSIRALVRSAEKAEQLIRPLGIEPVIGSLNDLDLLSREAQSADVVLNFADADNLPAVKAILHGLNQPRLNDAARKRPILIHTSGTGVLTDNAYGAYVSEDIYYDNDVRQLSTLAIEQPHRTIDLEIISSSLVGIVDTYIVAPPMIFGFGTGPGNRNSIQIPLIIRASLDNGRALQIGKGLSVWNKVHVIDLAHLYILLLERSLKEPQTADRTRVLDDQGNRISELPKNEDAYYFVEDGEFTWGSVAQTIDREFARLGINDAGQIHSTCLEEEESLWPPGSHAGMLVGSNSRSRAVKAREILDWEPQFHDLEGYIAQELERQRNH